MSHPFDLNASELETIDLNFEQELTDEEAAQIGGGQIFTTLALGEEGGNDPCVPKPKNQPKKRSKKHLPSPKPPEVTTLALGEEGGCFFK